MTKFKVTIFGAGNLGSALAVALNKTGVFAVQMIDPSEDALERFRRLDLDVAIRAFPAGGDLHLLLEGQDLAVAAVPDGSVAQIAAAAARAGTHYLDFVCTDPQARTILEPLSERRAVLLGCGVSPGFIGNVGCGLLRGCSDVADLTLRVGALPRFATNRLGYGQIWNIDGLIDEYTRPGVAIRDGRITPVSPLEEYGQIAIDGVTYEEFTTSGGVEDLEIFSGPALRNVTFKTLRYPGHLDYMRFLLDDLGLRQRRDMLKSLLYNGLPLVEDDVLMLVATARGYIGRQPTGRTVVYRFSPGIAPAPFNALTSVASGYAASLIAMLHEGEIAPRGIIAHHLIDTELLLSRDFLRPLFLRSPPV